MLWKAVFILSCSIIAFDLQTPQLRTPGERQSDSLPQELTETETQTILRERSPKPHIDAALKVSDARIASALRLLRDSQYEPAARDADVYAALIVYSDAYTRKLPPSQIKDRNSCLKMIEQAIFKQSHTVEAVLREFTVDYRQAAEARIDQVKKIRLRAINDLLGDGRVIKTSEE
jgi:hypothetical protein